MPENIITDSMPKTLLSATTATVKSVVSIFGF